MTYSTLADLTIDEFKNLIKEIVTQTILEIFDDPDEGLELREEIKDRLHRALADAQTTTKTTSAQEVAAKLGLEW